MVAGCTMLLGVGLIVAEILVRNLLNGTLYITGEYTGYLMVSITFLGLAYTMKEKEHIRITVIHKFIKSCKKRLFIDIYANIVGLAMFLVVIIATTNLFWNSLVTESQSGQVSATYLAIPQFALPLGAVLITLQFVSEIIKLILKLRRSEFSTDVIDTD